MFNDKISDKKKNAFTMIELIFVIVILGILAAVAVPRFMTTRIDAKISATTEQIQNIIKEIRSYAVVKGKVTSLDQMSEILKNMSEQTKAKIGTDKTVVHFSNNINFIDSGMISYAIVGVEDAGANLEDCIGFEVNSTTFKIIDNPNSTGDVCSGIKDKVKDATFIIGGRNIEY